MEITGERYIPGMDESIEIEHLHRYAVAKGLVGNLDVLDIASGEGYGSAILASAAKSVVGVDIALEAIHYARAKYNSKFRNLRFLTGSCASVPLPDDSVDAVVSFETLEHHSDHHKMMEEVRRVLRPDGFLVISTPNIDVYRYANNHVNPYHVKEIGLSDLLDLLKDYFDAVLVYGQFQQTVSILSPLHAYSGAPYVSLAGSSDKVHSNISAPISPTYLIAVCADSIQRVPQIASSVFFKV